MVATSANTNESQKRWFRTALITVACLGIAYLLLQVLGIVAIVAPSWGTPFCNDVEKKRVTSPDGEYTALLLQRDCGFAAETYAHVDLIVGTGAKAAGLADNKNRQDTIFATTSRTYEGIGIRWLSTRSLLIQCEQCSVVGSESNGVLIRKDRWSDVAIRYETVAHLR